MIDDKLIQQIERLLSSKNGFKKLVKMLKLLNQYEITKIKHLVDTKIKDSSFSCITEYNHYLSLITFNPFIEHHTHHF